MSASDEIKKQAISMHQSGMTLKAIAETFGYTVGAITYWFRVQGYKPSKRNHGPPKNKKIIKATRTTAPPPETLEVAYGKIKEGQTIEEAAKDMGVGKAVMQQWINNSGDHELILMSVLPQHKPNPGEEKKEILDNICRRPVIQVTVFDPKSNCEMNLIQPVLDGEENPIARAFEKYQNVICCQTGKQTLFSLPDRTELGKATNRGACHYKGKADAVSQTVTLDNGMKRKLYTGDVVYSNDPTKPFVMPHSPPLQRREL